VRALEVIFVASMRLVGCGDVVVLGHRVFPPFGSLRGDDEAEAIRSTISTVEHISFVMKDGVTAKK
jgi:hypothetical protein